MARDEEFAPSEATVFSVTVTVQSAGTGRARLSPPGRVALACLLLAAAVAAVGAGLLSMSAPSVQTQAAERAAIASSLGYPSRCVRVSISIGISDYARANLGHGTGCSRYHGYVNGSFHRVDGSWRLVLDEGQLFVPNRLLVPRTVPRGCLRLAIAFHDPWAASHHRVCTRARSR